MIAHGRTASSRLVCERNRITKYELSFHKHSMPGTFEMRSFFLVVTVAFLCFGSTDLFAQSGSRGSGSRGRSGGSMRSSMPQSRPSRTGRAPSARRAPQAMPSGILNSARHATSSRVPTTGITSSRSSLPYRPSPSVRGGASPSLTGLSTKRRTPRTPKSYAASKTSTATGGSSTRSTPSQQQSTTTTLVGGSDSFANLKDGSRTWTDASGRFKINGKLAAYQNGTVWIRRDDGLVSKLSVSQLSPADQRLVVGTN